MFNNILTHIYDGTKKDEATEIIPISCQVLERIFGLQLEIGSKNYSLVQSIFSYVVIKAPVQGSCQINQIN